MDRMYRFCADARTFMKKAVEKLDADGDAALTVGERVQVDIWHAFQRFYDDKFLQQFRRKIRGPAILNTLHCAFLLNPVATIRHCGQDEGAAALLFSPRSRRRGRRWLGLRRDGRGSCDF
jgi:hypothetical protein